MSVTGAARRRLKPEVRRERLLEAATGVFADRGYEAARVEQIAKAAGVSSGLLYRHFAGKRDLYAELAQRGTSELLRRLTDAAAPGAPSGQRLARGLDAFLTFVEERPELWRMLMRDVVDPEIAALRDEARDESVRVVASLIALDPELGRQKVPELQLEEMAVVIVGSAVSVAAWWADHPGTGRRELLGALMNTLWLGFGRLRAGDRYEPDDEREGPGDLTNA